LDTHRFTDKGILKRLYYSHSLETELTAEIKSLFEKEAIKAQQINNGTLNNLFEDNGADSLKLLLLSENDKLLQKDKEFWERLKASTPILVLPVFAGESGVRRIRSYTVPQDLISPYLILPFNLNRIELSIRHSFNHLYLVKDHLKTKDMVVDRSREIEQLTEIGKALSAETNYNRLLKLILSKAKDLLNCDAASIYIVENVGGEEKRLTFKLSDINFAEEGQSMPLNKKSIAGYVALTSKTLNLDDAYRIPEGSEYSLNLSYDQKYAYRTKSMLVIPMLDHEGIVIGVLQLINKKRSKQTVLSTIESMEKEVISFSSHDMELADSLAGQAAVAVQSSHFEQRTKEIKELTNIGQALATERNHLRLLKFILDKGKELTQSDGGSIYLAEEDELKNRVLRFKFSSLELKQDEYTFPIDENSISGYVAKTKEILNLEDAYVAPPDANYKLNLEYDIKHQYRTKSMLVVPMTNQKDEVIGVLQLINKKKDKSVTLSEHDTMEKYIASYDDHDIALVKSIAGQAAVAIENNILYQNIEKLFEGFVRASVTAIESRDPTTSGHSERVAIYTVELAKLVDNLDNGIWRDVSFSRDQIREIRYASLLHDFGKVGVREKILVKAKKLYPYELDLIESRFNFIRRTLQYESSKRKVEYLINKSRDEALKLVDKEDEELYAALAELDRSFQIILNADNPKVMESDINQEIHEIARRTYIDITGQKHTFLDEKEVRALAIKKGSLGEAERLEIESHVTHTFEFLSRIPWTPELNSIPNIAYAHHEKLNGGGYPRKLTEKEIPIQSRLMTVSDIYDALVARDRPYKKAVDVSRALDILKLEVKDSHIDPGLVDLFIDAKIYKAADNQ